MRIEHLYADIVGELERKADSEQAKKDMYYHKKVGDGFRLYGISTRAFNEVVKKYWQTFKELSFDERVELARRFFGSGYAGQMSLGIDLLKLNAKEMKPSDFGILEYVGDRLNNWGSVDEFCIDVLQPLLRSYPEQVLEILGRWNKAESLWKRRASVVAFTRKVGASGKFTDEALKLCDTLVWDEEDLVKKGVGWALKDVMRGDKKKVLEYVKGLRLRGVSAVITLYAMRDLRGEERNRVLRVRRQPSLTNAHGSMLGSESDAGRR